LNCSNETLAEQPFFGGDYFSLATSWPLFSVEFCGLAEAQHSRGQPTNCPTLYDAVSATERPGRRSIRQVQAPRPGPFDRPRIDRDSIPRQGNMAVGKESERDRLHSGRGRLFGKHQAGRLGNPGRLCRLHKAAASTAKSVRRRHVKTVRRNRITQGLAVFEPHMRGLEDRAGRRDVFMGIIAARGPTRPSQTRRWTPA